MDVKREVAINIDVVILDELDEDISYDGRLCLEAIKREILFVKENAKKYLDKLSQDDFVSALLESSLIDEIKHSIEVVDDRLSTIYAMNTLLYRVKDYRKRIEILNKMGKGESVEAANV